MVMRGRSSLKLTDDPSDPVWRWLVQNGPHGDRFNWGSKGGIINELDLLKRSIAEKTAADDSFPEKARRLCRTALANKDQAIVRRAIQVLSVVGTSTEFELIKNFLTSDDLSGVNDAMCCLFENGIKLKS
jgi:hypothetical protein